MDDRATQAKPEIAGLAVPQRSYARAAWAAALVLVLARVAVVPLIPTPWIMADEVVYQSCAYEIAHHFRFSARLKAVQPYPPGYSLTLVPACYLGGPRAIYAGMLVTNCLLASLAGILGFYVARRFVPERDAFFASVLIGLLPSVNVYCYVLMSENLFTPLVMLSCLLVVRACESRSPLSWLWVGVCAGGLAVTRSVGLVAIPAVVLVVFVEWARRRQWLYGLAGLGAVIVGVAIFEAPWFIIQKVQGAGAGNVTGYHEGTYLANLKEFLTNAEIFAVCLRLGLDQWLGVALASGGILLVFALDLLLRPRRTKSGRFGVLAVYFLLLAGAVTLATTMHMWRGFHWRRDWNFALITRYMDPLVPVVVVFGVVGLVRLREGRAGRLARARIALVALAGVVALIVVYPLGGYKFPSVLSVWYVEPMHAFLDPSGPGRHTLLPTDPPPASDAQPVSEKPSLGDRLGLPAGTDVRRVAIAVVAVAVLLPFVFFPALLRKRYVFLIGGLLVAANAPSILQEVRVSRDADHMNAIPKWLCDHAEPGASVYLDEGDYYRGKGIYLFYALCFWNPDLDLTRYRRDVPVVSPDYVVSWDRLPFRAVVAAGPEDSRRYLYATAGREAVETLVDDPRYFDVARMPPASIENGWPVEEDTFLWTKERTGFRFRYDLPEGPWVLALSGGGPRPRYRAAKMRVLIDGHLLKLPREKRSAFVKRSGTKLDAAEERSISHLKGPGDAVWRFPVPAGAAAPGDEHVLTVEADTFAPADYFKDSPDHRDIGIQVYWFKIETPE